MMQRLLLAVGLLMISATGAQAQTIDFDRKLKALGVELLSVHRSGVDDRSDSGGAELFEGVDGFGHITSPAHSWDSSQQHPA